MAFKIEWIDAGKDFVQMSHQNDLPGVYGRRDFVGFDLSRCSDIALKISAVLGGNHQGEIVAAGWMESALGKIFRREPVVRKVLLNTPTTKHPASILRITEAEKNGERWLYLSWNDTGITQQYSFATTEEELEQLVRLLDELAEKSKRDQSRGD
jgi:hypothetical protein